MKITFTKRQASDGTWLYDWTFQHIGDIDEDMDAEEFKTRMETRRRYRRIGYAKCVREMRRMFPDWRKYGYGLTGEGVSLHANPLAPCTCH